MSVRGKGHSERSNVIILFTGALDPKTFSEFVAHRAHRLDLDARLGEIGPDRVSVAVSGEPDLIDAFEIACSLGPINCLVLDVVRHRTETALWSP
jgi:hypothetical protein